MCTCESIYLYNCISALIATLVDLLPASGNAHRIQAELFVLFWQTECSERARLHLPRRIYPDHGVGLNNVRTNLQLCCAT